MLKTRTARWARMPKRFLASFRETPHPRPIDTTAPLCIFGPGGDYRAEYPVERKPVSK